MTANSNNELLWNALLDNNNMQYAVRIKAINKGGSISNDGGRLIVKNADEVLILLTADTDYKENFDPDFNDPKTYVGEDPVANTGKWMKLASTKGYNQLWDM